MPRSFVELYRLVVSLTDRSRRTEVARAVAARAGAEDLIIFVRDEEIGILLPAPGFRQTLPDSRRWRTFLSDLERQSPLAGTLPFPGPMTAVAVLGVRAPDGSALILMGGVPRADTAAAISLIVPALAAAFRGEHAAVAAAGHAAVARETAGQAKLLTASLESARQSLQIALGKADAANAAKDQFLAVLSHELRTPLAPVLTTASALLARGNLPEDTREAMELIRRNVELEARLIDDLLDLTRIARGKMQLNFDVVDAHESIRRTVDICRSDIYCKRLNLETRLEAAEHHVRADSARLQQVLWNIIKNAVKFTPHGGRLVIASSNAGSDLRVSVTDSGIGIAPRHLATIFNAFEQTSDEITRRFGGLGLGLAIAHALAQSHGGTLVAESEGEGRGATFTISLPTVRSPARVPASSGEQPPGPAAHALRLLLVEDHPDTAMVMARLLRMQGHEVATAQSVATALQLAENHAFDLVVSDLGLPDGSGLELMATIRNKYGLSGVAISGFGAEEDLARAKSAGFFTHLTKPVNFQQVEAVLKQFAATFKGVGAG